MIIRHFHLKLVAVGVDPGPKLEEDPGHDAVARAGGLHQGGVTILIVVLQLYILYWFPDSI